jgi:hypothetical protein
VAFLVALILVGGGGAAWYWWTTRDALADPTTVALPDQTADGTVLVDYFTGPGAPLLTVLDQTSTVNQDPTTDDCTATATGLDQAGQPDALLGAANNVPDPGVRDAAVNHLDAVAQYLSACGTADQSADQATRVQFTATIFDRLLTRAGVR